MDVSYGTITADICCMAHAKLFKLSYRTHNYLVCGIVECITVKLDRRLTKFVHSMINSKNNTVRELIAHN